MKQFDLIVIGWGKAGKTLAGEAAARGERVAIVERSPLMYGGTCVNVGCIPTKFLVEAAGRVARDTTSDWMSRRRFYAETIAAKNTLTSQLRNKMYTRLADQANVTVFNGVARFVGERTIEVGEQQLQGTRVVINTGSSPALPPVAVGLPPEVLRTSETLLAETELPRRLVIIGGGFIALEFAAIYGGFGSEVTLLQRGERFLPHEDPEVATAVAADLKQRGVTIITSAAIDAIETTAAKNGAEIVWHTSDGKKQRTSCELVLVATGRVPNTNDLNTAAGGIALNDHGAIVTDDALRTSAPGVWAAGDVTGRQLFTYTSLDDARIIGPQLAGLPAEYTLADRNNVPTCAFLKVPLARIGLNEQDVLAAHRSCRILTLPAAAIPKAKILGETSGILKAIVTDDGTILGATLYCPESHELINQIKLAMDAGIKASTLARQIYTHPTMSEAFNDLFSLKGKAL